MSKFIIKYLLFVLFLAFTSFVGTSCKSSKSTASFSQNSGSLTKEIKSSRKEKKKKRKGKSKINPVAVVAIKTAKSYVGTPYKFGGTTRAGMDCSGLIMLSYRKAGLNLPRTSNEQAKLGKSIKPAEARPGDLVFFSYRDDKQISHVGMITQVKDPKSNITFIHASTKLGVCESNLYSDHYKKVFVKAKRVLD